MTMLPVPRMNRAVRDEDVAEIRRVLEEYPDQKRYLGGGSGSWLHFAAEMGSIPVIDVLVDGGIDVNFDCQGADEPDPPLIQALCQGHFEAARHLISRGADVNLGRSLIAAIGVTNDRHLSPPEREARAFELVKLLVESGADVNQWWHFGEPKRGVIVNALSWALSNGREDIADYLRAQGAVMPPASAPRKPPKGIEEEVVAYFEEHLGPVDPRALLEIVPTGSSVTVHAVRPSKDRRHITLFSTGLARKPMKMPKDLKDYQYGELFIQLPANWPYMDIANADHAWPVHWLRMMAEYGQSAGLQPVTIGENEPGKPIALNAKFTAMLIMAEKQFTAKKGYPVHLYRMTPLYPEERELEQREGVAALMRAFDKCDVPFIVDLNRRNVAL